jgi:choice-of-anchor A domain-containing protein
MSILSRTFTALSFSIISSMAVAGPIDLGDAGDYTLLSVGAVGIGSMIVGSSADITGNIGARWHTTLGSGVRIDGDVNTSTYTDQSKEITGNINTLSETQWVGLYNDIAKASTEAASYSGVNFNSLYNTSTFTAYDDLSVFNIFGDVLLESGESLTLSGDADDEIIINVSGNFKLGSGVDIVLDGFQAENVLFNFIGTGDFAFGGSVLSGTYLGLDRNFVLGDGATLSDTRFLSRSMQANVQVVTPPTTPPVLVPAPATALLMFVGLFGILRKRKAA